ncbi:MAG: hypothetical protein E7Z79_08760 [Methanobrevibacter thaueri]|uniref:ArnR1-like winged helix-turn-helix domain-containing protein n=1 Tax=Methanobrevibacter thaueri TaxID=190975 RepID=A0A8T3VCC8_9EURY|nr:hypothetical protein [Methanobrevibacter thaueri]MBE6495242.1 hypothetical protein [Methanobrevibacter thaueri]MBE6502510.1 hypothetical protein [Methanobrevibacter thaueri]
MNPPSSLLFYAQPIEIQRIFETKTFVLYVIRIIATSMKTPTEIVEEMDARFSLVSRILGDLKDKEILVCVNEEDETGRLYKLTEIGLKIHNNL